MIGRAAISACLVAAPLQAGQPISQSLTDCAALHMLNAARFERLGSGARAGQLDDWANAMLLRSLDLAESEGVDDPLGAMQARFDATTQDWSGRGLRALFSEEYRDWMRYCMKLSDHLGIKRPDF